VEGGAVMASPVVVSVTPTGQDGNSLTFTMNMPATRPQGDLFIAFVASDANQASFTEPGNWNVVEEDATGPPPFAIYWWVGGPTEPSSYDVVGGTAQEWSGAIYHITGADTSSPIDAETAKSVATSNTPTAPTLTPTVNDALVIAFVCIDTDFWDGTDPYPGGSWTNGFDQNSGSNEANSTNAAGAYQAIALQTASGTAVFLANGSDNWLGYTISIKPSGGASNTETPSPIYVEVVTQDTTVVAQANATLTIAEAEPVEVFLSATTVAAGANQTIQAATLEAEFVPQTVSIITSAEHTATALAAEFTTQAVEVVAQTNVAISVSPPPVVEVAPQTAIYAASVTVSVSPLELEAVPQAVSVVAGTDATATVTPLVLEVGPQTVVRPHAFGMAASDNITAGGENTTFQLEAPSGKTTSNFGGGRIQDDENPGDTVDLASNEYREDEWCIEATTDAVVGEQYEFRVLVGGSIPDTISVTPKWTIGINAAQTPGPVEIDAIVQSVSITTNALLTTDTQRLVDVFISTAAAAASVIHTAQAVEAEFVPQAVSVSASSVLPVSTLPAETFVHAVSITTDAQLTVPTPLVIEIFPETVSIETNAILVTTTLPVEAFFETVTATGAVGAVDVDNEVGSLYVEIFPEATTESAGVTQTVSALPAEAVVQDVAVVTNSLLTSCFLDYGSGFVGRNHLRRICSATRGIRRSRQ
jgi:hypothetical protein